MRVFRKKVLLLFLFIFLIGCNKEEEIITEHRGESEKIQEVSLEETVEEEEYIPEEPVFEEYDLQLMAVGDNLLHMGIVSTGQQADGSYNFEFLFQGIEEYLNLAEIKIINQETILGGNELGFSGYPLFNSPTEVGDSIEEAGFNVVLHATNHSADKGLDGLLHCVEFWEEKEDILMVGIDKDSALTYAIPVLELEGLKIAVLNYTYSPNTEIIPKSIQGYLNILCDWDLNTGQIDFTKLNPQVVDDIKRAEEIADFTIVCPHWGTEYATKPSDTQRNFAKQITEAGADLIIGTHPHVLQPVEWIEGTNGESALCFYSLGNYVSTQKDPLNLLEGMAWVTLHVQEDGIFIQRENTGILPLVCQYEGASPRLEIVYALEDYTEELASKHGIISYGGRAIKLEDLNRWSHEILGDWVLSSEEIVSN